MKCYKDHDAQLSPKPSINSTKSIAMILSVQSCAILGMAMVANALGIRSDGTTTSPTATASMPTSVGPYGQCMMTPILPSMLDLREGLYRWRGWLYGQQSVREWRDMQCVFQA